MMAISSLKFSELKDISFTNKNIGNGTYEEIKYYDVIVNDDLEIKIEKQKRVAN